MSNTCARVRASSGVSRSNSRVASPPAFSERATETLRGLSRLLPLPWANSTIPVAPGGTCNVPGSSRPFTVTTTSSGGSSAGDGRRR
jgi:hypothetical protein